MDLGLNDQIVVVIGAASGIGRAIADTFAAEKAALALVDRNPVVADVAARLHQEHGIEALPCVADVTDYPAMQQAAAQIEEELGPVAHVVYTVAIGSGQGGFPFWNLEPKAWEPVLKVNLQGAVNAAHAFLAPMVARRQGTFLFLGSVAGQIGSQTDPPYSASKAALINFAQCAAQDLAEYNIRVNTLNPGMVKTPLNRAVWDSVTRHMADDERPDYDTWAADKIKRLVPLDRWQEPEDIAAMAVFLASSQAKNVTGQTINVDGGYVMHW